MAVIGRETDGATRAGASDVLRLMSTPWALVPILLAAFAVYAPTLADWFVGDDFWFLRASQQHGIGSEIARSFDYRNVGTSIEFDRYRPLYPIAWRLQYAVFGLNAFPYHAVVLALHVACVATVWFIARRLFRESWAVNLAALIFAVHPVYMDAVAWISGGNRVFAALPYLLALLCYMRSRDAGEQRRAAWYAASVALFIVAVGFHSASLTIAAVIAAYRFLIVGEPRDALHPRAWLPLLPYAAIIAASAAVQAYVRTNIGGAEEGFRFGYHQYANYGAFLGMTVQPIEPSNFGGIVRTILSDIRGVGSVAVLVGCVALIARSREQRLAVLLTGWLFVSLLPDSTLILGPSGRALYMPGAAFALLVVAAMLWLREELPQDTRATAVRVAPYVLVAVVPLVMFVTYGRTRDVSHDASRSEVFVERLRRDVTQPPAGTLYVSNVPSGFTAFGASSRVDAAAELYYGDARIVVVPDAQVAAVKAALKPGDQFYEYKP